MKQKIKNRVRRILDRVVIDPLHYHKNMDARTRKIEHLSMVMEERTKMLASDVSSIREMLDQATHEIASISSQDSRIYNIARAQYDRIPALKDRLLGTRISAEYEKVFANSNPLITVRIATYNNAADLVGKAINSVLGQSYQNFEIIVVGDHCTDDTEEKVRALQDERITFINLPYRNVYPEDPVHKWMVAGSPGMNLGAGLAKGDWIAPLDDDDEFSADHLEKLLRLALAGRYEMVYGKIISENLSDGQETEIWSYPPELGKFSFQGALYMRMINFFEWDVNSWVVDEPGDWNLCRRMMSAGVRIGATDDVVGRIFFQHQKRT